MEYKDHNLIYLDKEHQIKPFSNTVKYDCCRELSCNEVLIKKLLE